MNPYVKAKTESIDQNTYTVSVLIDAAKVQEIENDIANSLKEHAVLPGFRKGTASTQVIKSRFRKQILAESSQQLLRFAAQELLRDPSYRNFIGPQLMPEDKPSKTKDYYGNFGLDGGFSFTCKLEQPPQVDPTGYKGVAVGIPFAKFETWVNKKILDAQIANGIMGDLHPADDALAKILGFDTLDDYISSQRDIWNSDFEKPVKTQVLSAVMDAIISLNPFEVPVAWVAAEYEVSLRKFGFKEPPNDPKVIEAVKEIATKSVRTAYLLDLIYAKEKDIHLTPGEVQKSIDEYALNANMTLEQAIKQLRVRNEYDGFITFLEQNKTLNFLVENANIKETQV